MTKPLNKETARLDRGVWVAVGALLASLTMDASATPIAVTADSSAEQPAQQLQLDRAALHQLSAELLRPAPVRRALESLAEIPALSIDPLMPEEPNLLGRSPKDELRFVDARRLAAEPLHDADFPFEHSGNLLRIELQAPGFGN